MDIHIFRGMFDKVQEIDLYILVKNDKDIGILFFNYIVDSANSKVLYVRPGIAIMPDERGDKFPKNLISKTIIKAKLKNPFKEVYAISVSINPIVYATSCKYWTYTYPNPFMSSPEKILEVKKRLIELLNMKEVAADVMEIPISVLVEDSTKKKFSQINKKNPYVDFFVERVKNND